jgi:uncharacterized protein YbjT (DUF2867 family)
VREVYDFILVPSCAKLSPTRLSPGERRVNVVIEVRIVEAGGYFTKRTKNMSKKEYVLVTGATGQQGGAVARELLKGGHPVRAVTRKSDGEKARALAKAGAEIIYGDLDDAGSLERALKGMWGVFSVQNTWEAGIEKEEIQGKRFAEIARRAGVKHFVYSSVGSAHRGTGIPHFDNKWKIKETVRKLGFPSFTVLRAAFFMENFASPWFKPGIDAGKLMVGLKPETVLQMINDSLL